MSKNRYVRLFNNIKADDNAVKRAVDSIYETENAEVFELEKKKSVNLRFVPILATSLVFVIILGLFIFPMTPKANNSFVIKAGASQINSIDDVEIGELMGENNALRISFDESDKANCLTQCKVVSFPVVCSGNNIDKVTYKVNGNGYFALLGDVEGVSGMVYVEEEPTSFEKAQKYPYNLADTGEYTEKVKEFTVDYEAQNESLSKLCLYTVDDNGKYCDLYNENICFEKSDGSFVHGKDLDYEQMYFELFTDGDGFDVINYSDYYVDVTVTFEDGTKETKIVNLGLEKTKKLYENGEDGEYTSLNIHAKLSK